jgi:hypothetical protein
MHQFWFTIQVFCGCDAKELRCVWVSVLTVLVSSVTCGQNVLLLLTTINTSALYTVPVSTQYICAQSEERAFCQPEVWSHKFRKCHCHAK